MKIYIIRHGIAVERDEWMGDDDSRPLTNKGVERMKKIAETLRTFEIKMDYIISSPLVRAVETAEIVKNGLKFEGKIQNSDLLIPGASMDSLIKFLNTFPSDSTLALVGHEPQLSEFISYLLSGQRKSFVVMKKGGIAFLECECPIEPGIAELKWLAEPNILYYQRA